MSSRSKALIGGALAIIFVITVANTNATAQLSKAVNNVNSRVASLPTQVQESYPQEEYYVGGQQAALGLVGVDIPEPDDEGGGGYWIYIGSDGDLHCARRNPSESPPMPGKLQARPATRCEVLVV